MTLSILLIAQFVNLIPDDTQNQLKTRARLAEALTIQLSGAATRNDIDSIQRVISVVADRDEDILSIALRRADGQLVASTPAHNDYWAFADDARSSPTHIRVPLVNGSEQWGQAEIALTPIGGQFSIIGFSDDILKLIGFFLVSGFLGYYFLLKRSLRQLDPKNAVPDRVQASFDTLDEGVIIVDEHENILLVNRAMATLVGRSTSELRGSGIGDLGWRRWNADTEEGRMPWQAAIQSGGEPTKAQLGLRLKSKQFRNFTVKAAAILNEDGKPSGAIVTFNDVTVLERQNEDLSLAVRKLEASSAEIVQKNKELQYLANHDPLSGSLNRRSLFEKLEVKFAAAKENGQPLVCLMVDLDHFKRVNDRFGHAVGDDVIIGAARVLADHCREQDLVGRYGGEEFCVILDGLSHEDAAQVAANICDEVSRRSGNWLPVDENVTASLGMASLSSGAEDHDALLEQADKALYVAKDSGRNRVVQWSDMSQAEKRNADDSADPKSRSKGENDASAEYTDNGKSASQSRVAASDDLQELHHSNMELAEQTPFEEQNDLDPLTGLPLPSSFLDTLDRSLQRSARNDNSVAILCLSIDASGQVDVAFSEVHADEIAKNAAQRLSAVFRQSDTVSFLGTMDREIAVSRAANNSFLIEVPNIKDTSSVTWIIQRILKELERPWPIDGKEYFLTSSVGVSMYPNDADDAFELVDAARKAHRKASEHSRINSFRFFSQEMRDSAERQLQIVSGLHEALATDQFSLYYQPIVDIHTGRVASAEALLRVSNDKLKGVSIQTVIEVAERSGLIQRVGDWILRRSIDQMKEWERLGVDLPVVSINVSAAQLNNPGLGDSLLRHIIESGCDPSRFQFEITETALIKDMKKASDLLKRIQKLGCHIALDDFGTGQSSLSYIQQLQPDAIKIDHSFVRNIDMDYSNEALVAAVAEMAARLGLRVVAEGVESHSQLDVLRSLGCSEIQGYLVSRPMPTREFTDWLRLFSENQLHQEFSGFQQRAL